MIKMKRMEKIITTIKGISKYILVNERINSQRCVAQNIDTTKTIIEHN